jgi:hypothetical protein
VHSLLRTLEHHGVPLTAAKAILVVALFVGATLLARLARFAARLAQTRTSTISLDSPLSALAQRDTAVSLRATTIRDVGGEVLRVHNSQIMAVRVLPKGGHEIEIELFVHDGDAGAQLIEHVAQIVPVGPTAFTRAPQVRHTQELDGDLYRVTADATVAAGRRWLAEELLPSLLKERAGDELIVHGPVVLPVDESASTRFARAERLREVVRRRAARR